MMIMDHILTEAVNFFACVLITILVNAVLIQLPKDKNEWYDIEVINQHCDDKKVPHSIDCAITVYQVPRNFLFVGVVIV